MPEQHYPYSSEPMRFTWRDRTSWMRASVVLASFAIASTLMSFTLATLHVWSLSVALPTSLALALNFAPRPPTTVGRIAKDLSVFGLAAAVWFPDHQVLLVLTYPLILALSVAIGTMEFARRIWSADADA